MLKGQICKLKCNKSPNTLNFLFPKDIVKCCHTMNSIILSNEDYKLL